MQQRHLQFQEHCDVGLCFVVGSKYQQYVRQLTSEILVLILLNFCRAYISLLILVCTEEGKKLKDQVTCCSSHREITKAMARPLFGPAYIRQNWICTISCSVL